MKAKHTAGPWKHEGDGDITGIENDPENGCVGPVDIASVYLRTVPGRTEANARLIAAAPELLVALEEIAAWTERWTRPGHPVATFARKAIAKATGDAP